MRVAIVSDTYHPDVNGVVKTISCIEKEFDQIGLLYKLFSPGNVEMSDAKHHFFKSSKFWFYNKLNFSFLTYNTFKAPLDNYKPDIIHVISEGPLGILATKYAKENKIKYVASYTTDLPNYFKYYTFDILKPALVLYLKNIHQHAFLNLVPSDYSIDQLESMGIYNNVKWQRGIDTQVFKPLENKKISKKKKLLYVGRIAKEKNIGVLIELAKLLNEIDFDFVLNFVGDGPIIDELKKDEVKNVNFLGIKRKEELSKIYRESDLFVFASEHETFGNVILEAMASGLPVVAAYKGGVRENLIDKFNGIAIYQTEAEHFKNAVIKIFKNEELYYEYSRNARAHTLGRSWRILAEELIGYYTRAYNDKGEK